MAASVSKDGWLLSSWQFSWSSKVLLEEKTVKVTLISLENKQQIYKVFPLPAPSYSFYPKATWEINLII